MTKTIHVPNIQHYEQVLAQSRMSSTLRTKIQSIINQIKSRGNLASPKQLLILQKMKTGAINEIKPEVAGGGFDQIIRGLKDKYKFDNIRANSVGDQTAAFSHKYGEEMIGAVLYNNKSFREYKPWVVVYNKLDDFNNEQEVINYLLNA